MTSPVRAPRPTVTAFQPYFLANDTLTSYPDDPVPNLALQIVNGTRGSPIAGSGPGVPNSQGTKCRNVCMNTPSVAPFRAASIFFVEAVAAVPVERYESWWSDEWR